MNAEVLSDVKLRLALVLALLVLARADGFISVLIVLGYFVLRRQAQLLRWTLLTIVPVVALHFMWRRLYYGEWLPNTYFAKVDGSILERIGNGAGGIAKIAMGDGLLPHLLILGIAAAGVLAFVRIASFRDSLSRLRFELLYALVILAYWLYIGGDHFGQRFLLCVYPAAIFIFALSYKQLVIKVSHTTALRSLYMLGGIALVSFPMKPLVFGKLPLASPGAL